MPNPLQSLYNNLTSSGKFTPQELGNYDSFEHTLKQPGAAKYLYNEMQSRGFSPQQIGTPEQFEYLTDQYSQLGIPKPEAQQTPTPSTQPVAQTSQPKQSDIISSSEIQKYNNGQPYNTQGPDVNKLLQNYQAAQKQVQTEPIQQAGTLPETTVKASRPIDYWLTAQKFGGTSLMNVPEDQKKFLNALQGIPKEDIISGNLPLQVYKLAPQSYWNSVKANKAQTQQQQQQELQAQQAKQQYFNTATARNLGTASEFYNPAEQVSYGVGPTGVPFTVSQSLGGQSPQAQAQQQLSNSEDKLNQLSGYITMLSNTDKRSPQQESDLEASKEAYNQLLDDYNQQAKAYGTKLKEFPYYVGRNDVNLLSKETGVPMGIYATLNNSLIGKTMLASFGQNPDLRNYTPSSATQMAEQIGGLMVDAPAFMGIGKAAEGLTNVGIKALSKLPLSDEFISSLDDITNVARGYVAKGENAKTAYAKAFEELPQQANKVKAAFTLAQASEQGLNLAAYNTANDIISQVQNQKNAEPGTPVDLNGKQYHIVNSTGDRIDLVDDEGKPLTLTPQEYKNQVGLSLKETGKSALVGALGGGSLPIVGELSNAIMEGAGISAAAPKSMANLLGQSYAFAAAQSLVDKGKLPTSNEVLQSLYFLGGMKLGTKVPELADFHKNFDKYFNSEANQNYTKEQAVEKAMSLAKSLGSGDVQNTIEASNLNENARKKANQDAAKVVNQFKNDDDNNVIQVHDKQGNQWFIKNGAKVDNGVLVSTQQIPIVDGKEQFAAMVGVVSPDGQVETIPFRDLQLDDVETPEQSHANLSDFFYNQNKVPTVQESEITQPQAQETQPEISPEQPTEQSIQPTEQQIQPAKQPLPTDENGNVDYDQLLVTNPDAAYSEMTKEFGQEGANGILQKRISDINDEVNKLDKKKGTVKEMADNQRTINGLKYEADQLSKLLGNEPTQPSGEGTNATPVAEQVKTGEPGVSVQPQPEQTTGAEPELEPYQKPLEEYKNERINSIPESQYMIRQSVGQKAEEDHKKAVENAIKEGKQVPPDVLKDYPDLQQEQQKQIQDKVDKMAQQQMKGKQPPTAIVKASTIEPTTPEGIALHYFIKGGKINDEALIRLYGNKGLSEEENRAKIRNEKNSRNSYYSPDGSSIDQIAHQLWQENENLPYSTEDYRNALEQAVQSYRTRTDMAKDLLSSHQTEQEKIANFGYSPEQIAEMKRFEDEQNKKEQALADEEFQARMNDLEKTGAILTPEQETELFSHIKENEQGKTTSGIQPTGETTGREVQPTGERGYTTTQEPETGKETLKTQEDATKKRIEQSNRQPEYQGTGGQLEKDRLNRELPPDEQRTSEGTSGSNIPERSGQVPEEKVGGKTSPPEKIQEESAKVETNPSDAQKEAENYRKGHIKVRGLDMSIENPKGSERSGTDQEGNKWSVKMNNTYGYIRGTQGKDGDHIDAFLSETPDQGNIYVVDQLNPKDGKFDEHKLMIGFNTPEEAKQAYLSNYADNWGGFGNITEVSPEDLKKWIGEGERKIKPFSDYKQVKEDPKFKLTEKLPEKIDINGKERPTTNSKGQPIAQDEKSIRNFWKWFGDSKVTDDKGKPLVVYHGTPREFNIFDLGKVETTRRAGFYFTENLDLAKNYAKDGNIIKSYVRIENPLNSSETVKTLSEKQFFEISNKIGIDKNNATKIFNNSDSDIDLLQYLIKNSGVKSVYKALYDITKFDGIIESNKGLGKTYIAFDPTQIKSALSNIGEFSPENPDIRYALVGEKGASRLDKAEEANTRLDNLSIARKMETDKKSAKDIRLATGWERGADGKWRYEISDAKLNPDKVETVGGKQMILPDSKLGDVLTGADELFTAYPKMKNEKIFVNIDPRNENRASFGPEGVRIWASDLDAANRMLPHEIQHYIQEKEGFAKGGTEQQFLPPEESKEVHEVANELKTAIKLKNSGKWIYKDASLDDIIRNGDLTPKLKEWAMNVAKTGENGINEFLKNTPFQMYKRLAGEVEARNVQTRLDLTPEERQKTLLSETQDVAPEDQIFLNRSLNPASVEVPKLEKPELPKTAGEYLTGGYAEKEKQYYSALKDHIDKVSSDNGLKVNAVQKVSDLPSHVKDEVKNQGLTSGDVKGVFDPSSGEIYLVMSNHANAEDATRTILHEGVAHKGLRGLFGSEYGSFLDNVYKSIPDNEKADIERLYGKDPRTVADEWLAKKAESDPKLNLVQQWYAKIRDLVRKHFGLKYTDNDITYLLGLSRKGLKEGTQDIVPEEGLKYNLADIFKNKPKKTVEDLLNPENRKFYSDLGDYIDNEAENKGIEVTPVQTSADLPIELRNSKDVEVTDPETGRNFIVMDKLDNPGDLEKIMENGKIAGGAEQVRKARAKFFNEESVKPGKGWSGIEALQHGEKLISEGADPNEPLQKIKNGEGITPSEMAVVNAHLVGLQQEENRAYDNLLENKTKENQQIFNETSAARLKYEQESQLARTQASMLLQTWNVGKNVDENTYTGLLNYNRKVTGHEFTPKEEAKAWEFANENKKIRGERDMYFNKWIQEMEKNREFAEKGNFPDKKSYSKWARSAADKVEKAAISRPGMFMAATPASVIWDGAIHTTATALRASASLVDAINKGVDYIKNTDWFKNLSDADKNTAEKQFRDYHYNLFKTKVTAEELQDQFGNKKDAKFTTSEALRLWNYAKENYINNGVTEWGDLIDGVVKDVGLTPEQVVNAFSTPKGTREITDEIFMRNRQLRDIQSHAKNWVLYKDKSDFSKYLQTLPRVFFSMKVLGHGGVGMITHAGKMIFDPLNWDLYFKNFRDQYKLMASKTYHERAMFNLEHDANYAAWLHSGLAIDPHRVYDDYQLFGEAFKKITGMGNRGFDILKLYRFDIANRIWSHLSAEEKASPEMLEKISKFVNHSTGTTKMRGLEPWMNVAFFAPRLEAARWQSWFGDPSRALNTYYKIARGKEVSAADRAIARVVVGKAVTMLTTYAGLLAGNQALLKATGSPYRVNFTDPTQSDWMRFKMGQRTVAVDGGMVNVIKFLGSLGAIAFGPVKMTGGTPDSRRKDLLDEVIKYAFQKASPIVQEGMTQLSRQTFAGDYLPDYTGPIDPRKKQYKTWFDYLFKNPDSPVFPIPISEGTRDVKEELKNQGMSAPNINMILHGALYAVLTGGAGARITTSYPPKTPAEQELHNQYQQKYPDYQKRQIEQTLSEQYAKDQDKQKLWDAVKTHQIDPKDIRTVIEMAREPKFVRSTMRLGPEGAYAVYQKGSAEEKQQLYKPLLKKLKLAKLGVSQKEKDNLDKMINELEGKKQKFSIR